MDQEIVMSEKQNVTELKNSKQNIIDHIIKKWFTFQNPLQWSEVTFVSTIYGIAIYGILTFPYITHYKTLFGVMWSTTYCAAFAVTAGAHRLWSHKSYEACLPFRFLVAMLYLSSGLFRIKKFVMIHRMHHKYTDTERDPHDSTRGFFYSHVGWLLVKRTKEIHAEWKKIDLTDVDADPVVRFAERYFLILSPLLWAIVPTVVPVYFWNESWYYAFVAMTMRLFCLVNLAGFINSFAHMVGSKPYDKNIKATNHMLTALMTVGEGWHNFHHTFPYDYRSSEFGGWEFDITGIILRFCKKLGIVYNLKTVQDSLVDLTANRKGDGSRFKLKLPFI